MTGGRQGAGHQDAIGKGGWDVSGAAVCLYADLEHGLGSAGCSVNWSSYDSASHQVSGGS